MATALINDNPVPVPNVYRATGQETAGPVQVTVTVPLTTDEMTAILFVSGFTADELGQHDLVKAAIAAHVSTEGCSGVYTARQEARTELRRDASLRQWWNTCHALVLNYLSPVDTPATPADRVLLAVNV